MGLALQIRGKGDLFSKLSREDWVFNRGKTFPLAQNPFLDGRGKAKC